MRTKSIAKYLGLSAVMLSGLLAHAPRAAESDDYGDGYRSGNFGRVRYIDGAATITRGEWDAAPDSDRTVNAPIFPGDAIYSGTGRAEVQLAGSHVVRIDQSTELTFLALPDPYADVRDNAVLQLSRGRMRLTVAGVQSGEEFRIDTPAGTAYILGDADLRIEVDPAGRTLVQSFRGVAEVVAEGGSVLVRSGTATEVASGLRPSDPVPFNTFALDGFDQWVEARESNYEDRSPVGISAAAYAAVPSEVRPYYRELDSYGDWSNTDDYGYVWYPASVAPGWRPYYQGSWGYGPSGYFWISNEPWGWAPYHYGRWVWTVHGWGWVPGRVFGGAWVAWSWGSLYVGWSPIDCFDRPVYVSAVHYDYYDSASWTFVSYRHLGYHDYSHYNVGYDHVGRYLSGAAVVTRPPHVRPGELARSVDARERAVRSAREGQAPPPTARATGRAAGSRPVFLDRERDLRVKTAERPASRAAAVKAPPAPRFPRRLVSSAASVRDGQVTPRTTVTPTGTKTRGRVANTPGQSTPAPRPGTGKSPAPQTTATGRNPGKTVPVPGRGYVISRPHTTDADPSAPRREVIQRSAGQEPGQTVATPRKGFVVNRPHATDSSPSRHSSPVEREAAEPTPPKSDGGGGPLHDLYMRMAQPRRTQAHGNPPSSEPVGRSVQGPPPSPSHGAGRAPAYPGARRLPRPEAAPPTVQPAGGGGKGGASPAPPPSPSAKTGAPKSKPSSSRPERNSPPPSSGRPGNSRHGSGRGR